MTILELLHAKNFDALESLGFEGVDASLEISLDEYGLAVAPSTQYPDEFIILYRNGSTWLICTLPESHFDNLLNDSWFDISGFLSYTGCKKQDWLLSSLACKVSDLISYYGTENIGL